MNPSRSLISYAWRRPPASPTSRARPHLELYVRWMQETRRFKPSTISRRFSVTAGFYRTCVIDGVLEHSPAEHVRRPKVAAESPTLGFTHLQFKSLLTAARQSPDPCDFALVAMLGSLACGSSRPLARISPTWARSTAIGCCACAGKAPRSSWFRCRQQSAGPLTGPSPTPPMGRSCPTAEAPGWTGTRPPPPGPARRNRGDGGPAIAPLAARVQRASRCASWARQGRPPG
jgi:hypothetical protein